MGRGTGRAGVEEGQGMIGTREHGKGMNRTRGHGQGMNGAWVVHRLVLFDRVMGKLVTSNHKILKAKS